MMNERFQASEDAGATPGGVIRSASDERASESQLTRRFREVYGELIDVKTAILAAQGGGGKSDRVLSQQMRGRLRRAVGARDDHAQGSILSERLAHEDLRYVMTALIDEQMIHLEMPHHQPWPGAEDWSRDLLEVELFGSFRAGMEVFARIDKLLLDRSLDVIALEQARIYLMVLGLGFRGGLRRPEHHEDLRGYARKLNYFINGAARLELRLMTADHALTVTGAGRERQQLPSARSWLWGLAVGVMIWLVGSTIIWMYHTSVISSLMHSIESLHKDPALDALLESARNDNHSKFQKPCATAQLCGDDTGQCGGSQGELNATVQKICCGRASP